MKKIIYLSALIIIFASCAKLDAHKDNSKSEKKSDKKEIFVQVPTFSPDSAYQFIQDQVDFGPRVPNSDAHKACALYLEQKLLSFGAEVVVQQADLVAFDGTILKSKNIIGSYNTDIKNRVLLFAHWDTRPWADHDLDKSNRQKPVLGANDGASGVGVLLEMARIFSQRLPDIGIDIIFFDSEDYGAPEDLSSYDTADSWCLGSQYWAKNKHIRDYRAKYGILLDMVGAPNAKFYREQYSDFYAKSIVDKVWKKAATLGFDNYFINQVGGVITDDHVYINQIAKIPSIDIIQYDPNTSTGFGHYWHTTNDTMKHIDKNTLNAVGTTLLHVIFS